MRDSFQMKGAMEHVLHCTGHDVIVPDVVRAEDCRVYDSTGRAWVDLESGTWSASLGHGHPRIRAAVGAQLERINHTGFNYKCPIVEDAARSVLALAGMIDGKCAFLSSGTEAVELATRVARTHTGRDAFLTFADSYLAAFGSAGAEAKSEWTSFTWSECTRCDRRAECDPTCPRLQGIPFESLAGFVFEPGSSSGLVRFPPSGLVRRLADQVRASGGLLVVDEVTTGIGRTGRWFGFEHYGLAPDLVALGKGLGSGYPVSACVLTKEVARRLAETSFKYSQSHLNDPLGAAVAREVIAVIEEQGLVARAEELGSRILAGLTRVAERCGAMREVRGRGLMIAVELEPGPGRPSARTVRQRLMDRGFLVTSRPGHEVLRLDPPLTLGDSDADAFVRQFEDALAPPVPVG